MLHYLGWVGETNANFFFVFRSFYFGFPGTPYIFRYETTFGFTMVLKTQGGTQKNNKKNQTMKLGIF